MNARSLPPRASRRLGDLVQSDIRRMTKECDRVGGINLGQGVCDMPTPPPVAEGAIAAIRARKSIYSYPEGIRELRDAIAEKLARDNGISADPAAEIVVTVGASGAYACAIHALLDPGDGILIPEPYYGYHVNAALAAGLEPHLLELAPPDFALEESRLRAALRPSTRAIVLCTPSNPSGAMLGRTELERIARVATERDLLVITDEVYEYIRYDGRRHISPATVSGLAGRTVTIMGLSKTFSITGWRLGYAVAPEAMARAIALVHDLFYVCAPTPLQHAVVEGFRMPRSYFDGLQGEYARRREILCSALDAAGMRPIWPAGAYYALADVAHWGHRTAREAAMALLAGTGVAAVPGSAFYRGATGERLLRFSFAAEDSALVEAAKRIRAFRPAAARSTS